jgi:XTP/dITP diphosphohydrolase
LATTNPGKLRELRALLGAVPVELVDPHGLGLPFEVAEDGQTYRENAEKKAAAGVTLSGLPTLADDSGLEVPDLGGAPGVRSARFAGEGAGARELVAALLRALGERRSSSPTAYFRCTAVLRLPDGRQFEGEGVLEGTIGAEPKGRHGFGYDPVFTLPDGRRLAELTLEEKNLLSHRARALAALEVRGAFDALIGG